jgi:hypothetical protein
MLSLNQIHLQIGCLEGFDVSVVGCTASLKRVLAVKI